MMGPAIRSIKNGLSGVNYAIDYDGTGRVTDVADGSVDLKYKYDASHNRVEDSANGTYEMGTNTDPVHGVRKVNGSAFQYSGNGNETIAGSLRFDYDSEGHVTKIRDGLKTLDTVINWQGELVATSSFTETRVILGPYAEWKGNQLREYLVVDRKRIGRFGNTGNFYYHSDVLGSLRAVTNVGTVAGYWDYDIFGNIIRANSSAALDETAVFAGGRAVGIGGRVWLGSRVYDPRRGAFDTPDEHDGEPREPRSLNPYAYVWHNPTRYVDSEGAWPDWSNPGYMRMGLGMIGVGATMLLFPELAAAAAIASDEALLGATFELAFNMMATGSSAVQIVGGLFQLSSDVATAESWDSAWSWASSMADPRAAFLGSVSLMAGDANAGFFLVSLMSLNESIGGIATRTDWRGLIGNGVLGVSTLLDFVPPQEFTTNPGSIYFNPPNTLQSHSEKPDFNFGNIMAPWQ